MGVGVGGATDSERDCGGNPARISAWICYTMPVPHHRSSVRFRWCRACRRARGRTAVRVQPPSPQRRAAATTPRSARTADPRSPRRRGSLDGPDRRVGQGAREEGSAGLHAGGRGCTEDAVEEDIAGLKQRACGQRAAHHRQHLEAEGGGRVGVCMCETDAHARGCLAACLCKANPHAEPAKPLWSH